MKPSHDDPPDRQQDCVVALLAEVLHRVPLHGHGVGVGVLDPADDPDRSGLDLDRLALALALGQFAVDLDRAARGQAGDLGFLAPTQTLRDGRVFRIHGQKFSATVANRSTS